MKSDRVHKFIKQLMALPYLPKEHIRSSFNRLHLTVPVSARPLRRLMSYIKSTWITNSKFPVNTWSLFGQSVMTNNDVEGWHQRLNKGTKPSVVCDDQTSKWWSQVCSIIIQIDDKLWYLYLKTTSLILCGIKVKSRVNMVKVISKTRKSRYKDEAKKTETETINNI